MVYSEPVALTTFKEWADHHEDFYQHLVDHREWPSRALERYKRDLHQLHPRTWRVLFGPDFKPPAVAKLEYELRRYPRKIRQYLDGEIRTLKELHEYEFDMMAEPAFGKLDEELQALIYFLSRRDVKTFSPGQVERLMLRLHNWF